MAVFKPESVRKNKESSTLLLKGENMNTFILGVDFFSKIKEIKDLNFEGIISIKYLLSKEKGIYLMNAEMKR